MLESHRVEDLACEVVDEIADAKHNGLLLVPILL